MKEEKKGFSFSGAAAFVEAYAATIYPFLRINIGKNHPGIIGFLGMGWILLWSAYAQAERLTWMIPIYLVGWLFHTIGSHRKRLHTHYAGEPFVAMRLFRMNERSAKQFGEPIISLAIGFGLLWSGYAEGRYFVVGAFALAVNQRLIEMIEQRRVDDMRDAMIEGEHLMNKQRRG
jgi:hypothetical protein